MTDFLATWTLARTRFDDIVKDLTHAQLNWRSNSHSLSAGDMALHVAGVEVWFGHQLMGQPVPDELAKLALAATEGVVNDHEFPFCVLDITPEFVSESLLIARQTVEPLLANPDPYRGVSLKSALGPIIDGTGAFVRLAQHPAYHQGQVHLLRTSAHFPKD